MRSLTVLLPVEFIEKIDDAKVRLPGVRSRSATLHLLAALGLQSLSKDGMTITLAAKPEAAPVGE